MPRIEKAYSNCRYGQLHFRTAGPAELAGKPALVMLHQNPSSSLEYEPLIRELAKDRQVIAFDLPGLGMSDAPPGPLSMEDYALALIEGIEALCVGEDQPAALFGFHTGTYLACEIALARPHLVSKIILSGIPFRDKCERDENLAAAKAAAMIREDGEDAFRWLKWLWTFTVTERLPEVALDTAIEIFADKASALPRRTWAYFGVWSYDAESRLPQVKQPVTILQPSEPLLEPSRKASELFPDARFVELPNLSRDVLSAGAQDFANAIRTALHE